MWHFIRATIATHTHTTLYGPSWQRQQNKSKHTISGLIYIICACKREKQNRIQTHVARKNYCPIANVQHAKLPKPEKQFHIQRKCVLLHNLLIFCLLCECVLCLGSHVFFFVAFCAGQKILKLFACGFANGKVNGKFLLQRPTD